MNDLKFPVLGKNKCYHYISCVNFFSVRYLELYVILQLLHLVLWEVCQRQNQI